MDFFRNIAAMDITADLQLIIRKGDMAGTWVVSVLLQNGNCGDNAKELIPPFNLRGTTEEMDRQFFEKITAPLQAASGLMDNMESFMRQLDAAKQKSVMEKEKTDRQKREKDARDKKYNEAMQKSNELEKQGKYRDAWMKLPEAGAHPEHAETIRKKSRELSDRFSPPDLFAAAPPVAVAPMQQATAAIGDDGQFPAHFANRADNQEDDGLNWDDEQDYDYIND